jgi:hypothetical protein
MKKKIIQTKFEGNPELNVSKSRQPCFAIEDKMIKIETAPQSNSNVYMRKVLNEQNQTSRNKHQKQLHVARINVLHSLT